MVMHESEDNANRMSEQVSSAIPGAVTLDTVEVREASGARLAGCAAPG